MAKRFTATEIWGEDWFIEMPLEYKLFWYYILAECDHGGLFKVNLGSFCRLNGVNLTSNRALELFNNGKERVRVISKSVWFIEDFFVYQYGEKLNLKNRVHKSVFDLYQKNEIKLTSIRGLIEVTEGVKDKDKDIVLVLETSNTVETAEVKKSQFPKPEDFNGLPEMKIGSAIQLIATTARVDIDSTDVTGLWSVFKDQNLTGKKFYQDEAAVYSHFLNWIRTQPFKDKPKRTSQDEKLNEARRTFKPIQNQ